MSLCIDPGDDRSAAAKLFLEPFSPALPESAPITSIPDLGIVLGRSFALDLAVTETAPLSLREIQEVLSEPGRGPCRVVLRLVDPELVPRGLESDGLPSRETIEAVARQERGPREGADVPALLLGLLDPAISGGCIPRQQAEREASDDRGAGEQERVVVLALPAQAFGPSIAGREGERRGRPAVEKRPTESFLFSPPPSKRVFRRPGGVSPLRKILRTYDSRDTSLGDFGMGWTLAIKSFSLRENRVPGKNWQLQSTGGMLPSFSLSGDAHTVSVTLPDGRQEVFEFRPEPVNRFDSQFWTAKYVPVGRTTTATLEQLQTAGSLLLEGGGTLTCIECIDLPGDPSFNPDRYLLTTHDGTQYTIRQKTLAEPNAGLEEMKDRNENRLLISDAGVFAQPSGKGITFTRSTDGRIVAVTDPAGNVRSYGYDSANRLTSYEDPTGAVTQYEYTNAAHPFYMTKILDPLGRPAIRNTYDPVDGRLIATTDAAGQSIEMTHDIAGQTETVVDRLGYPQTFVYDERGNVTDQFDQLGRRTTRTYDEKDNETRVTNAAGETWTKEFDFWGDLTRSCDPLQNCTVSTFDAHSNPLTMTDPRGNTSSFTYDDAGNLIQTRDALGGTSASNYDARGNLTSTRDPLGNRTTMTYDSAGNMTSRTDANDVVTTYTFDTNGNQTSQTTAGRTSRSVYDGMNRLVQSVDPLGHSTSAEYNAIGQVVATTDKRGARTTSTYDDLGKLVRTDYADGTHEESGYDLEGRRVTSTDRNGVTTTSVFDAAGQLTRTVRQDGVYTESQYDVAGRVKYQWDARRNRTEYGYDGAGRRTSVTDALSHTTSFGFDAAGNQTFFTDALNHTTASTFDALGRQTRTTFDDGSHSDTEYDATGRRTASVDQGGKRTEFGYDPIGRLTSVRDSAGGQWSYAYNERGERVAQTDAEGETTGFEYDVLGRMTKRTLPLGQSERMEYDENGNATRKTNPNGTAVTLAYDVMNRPTSRQVPTRGTTSYTYTATGKVETVTDGRGTTRYEHDCVRSCVVTRVDNPDSTWLAYEYDAAGNRTAMVTPAQRVDYGFDVLNRIEEVEQGGQVTHFSYDAVGNRSGVTRPNGTWTEYVYNNLNRLTDIRHFAPGGSLLNSFHYDLGAAGNRVGVTEGSGRSVAYGYDDLYRLTSETITDPVAGNRTIGYTYSPVGNRLTKTDSVAGETSYSYDENDRLLSETSAAGTTTYTWDDAGRNTGRSGPAGSVAYTWDPEDRMLSAGDVSYEYDHEGLRVAETVGGVKTSFLLDKVRPYAQVVESRSGGAVVQSFLFGDDLVSLSVPGTGTFFYLADGQNSVRNLTDAAGAIAASYVFDAFGVELAANEEPGIGNPMRYVGEWVDPNTGFTYLRSRWLGREVGRFLSSDQFATAFPGTSILHPYLYANGSPVSLMDPTGQFPVLSAVLTMVAMIGILAVLGCSPGAGKRAVGPSTKIIEQKLALLDAGDGPGFLRPYFTFAAVGYGLGGNRSLTTSHKVREKVVLKSGSTCYGSSSDTDVTPQPDTQNVRVAQGRFAVIDKVQHTLLGSGVRNGLGGSPGGFTCTDSLEQTFTLLDASGNTVEEITKPGNPIARKIGENVRINGPGSTPGSISITILYTIANDVPGVPFATVSAPEITIDVASSR